MAAASSSEPFFGIREVDLRHHLMQQQQQQQQVAPPPPPPPSSATPTASSAAAPAPPKKKRSLPGHPNPDAEVIALSPKTLLATNRFICEVCNKGFQREQNLQLHRRGHNLPWKLRQKSAAAAAEVRQRVYLCPEPSCVHHDPSRALGDLTGIKKHFSRKHGEKKWRCDKCSKRYAVHSDLKAHSKVCGTREYRCDCGTLFSRRDSFVTHRAFCDALAQESARRLPTSPSAAGSRLYGDGGSTGLGQALPSGALVRLGGGAPAAQFDRLIPATNAPSNFRPAGHGALDASSSPFFLGSANQLGFREPPRHPHETLAHQSKPFHGMMLQLSEHQDGSAAAASSAAPTAAAAAASLLGLGFFGSGSSTSGMYNSMDTHLLAQDQFISSVKPEALYLAGNDDVAGEQMDSGIPPSPYGAPVVQKETMLPQMSATALLQKAAQMGATTSNGVSSSSRQLTGGFGAPSSPPASTAADFLPAGFGSGPSENEAYLQDFMNSLADGSAGLFGGGGGSLGGFRQSLRVVEAAAAAMLQRSLPAAVAAGMAGVSSDRLTRDFLGVGSGAARGMGAAAGDMSSQSEEKRHVVDMGYEMKFGGGSLP